MNEGSKSAVRRPVVLAAALLLATACGEQRRELHVFTWGGYMDRELLDEFEKESGAVVVESNYSSNEEMHGKLLAGGSGYDVVCPSDYAVVQLVRDGLLLPIDKARVPNLVHLGERFKAPPYDPALAHSVPFQWGVTGIGYDSAKTPSPPRSWKELFDAGKDGRLGKLCLLNDQREVLGAALLALGHSPNSRDAAEIAAARDLVASVKSNVAKFDSDDPPSALGSGEAALAQGWNGTFASGRRDVAPTIAFLVPAEGTLAYVDNWSIPKGARDVALAHAFIDWCLRPEVAAKFVERKLYPSCNDAATALLPKEIVDGICYAKEATRGAKLVWLEDLGPAGDLYTAAWDELRAE